MDMGEGEGRKEKREAGVVYLGSDACAQERRRDTAPALKLAVTPWGSRSSGQGQSGPGLGRAGVWLGPSLQGARGEGGKRRPKRACASRASGSARTGTIQAQSDNRHYEVLYTTPTNRTAYTRRRPGTHMHKQGTIIRLNAIRPSLHPSSTWRWQRTPRANIARLAATLLPATATWQFYLVHPACYGAATNNCSATTFKLQRSSRSRIDMPCRRFARHERVGCICPSRRDSLVAVNCAFCLHLGVCPPQRGE